MGIPLFAASVFDMEMYRSFKSRPLPHVLASSSDEALRLGGPAPLACATSTDVTRASSLHSSPADISTKAVLPCVRLPSNVIAPRHL